MSHQHEPTDEQHAIVNVARTTNHSLLVEALAGTGKTWTLIEIIKVLPQASAIVLAFNKRIAEEMARRLPKLPRTRLVHVKTLHSAGLAILNAHHPRLKLDKDDHERLIDRACGKGTPFAVRSAGLKLLRLAKDFQHEPVLDADIAFYLGLEFAAFDKLEPGPDQQDAIEIAQRAYEMSLNVAEREAIDFSDMGWLPLVLGLDSPSKYKAVLLDEAQDVNPNQLAMVDKLLVPGGRVIAAGDRNQAIYGWRGATPEETWQILEDKYKARRMPLTITWRCDHAIVRQANELVPTLRARADAGPGEINVCTEAEFHDVVREIDGHVFVLSRNNAELMRVALEMWRRKIPFNIAQSPEVVGPIKAIVSKLLKTTVPPPPKPKTDDMESAIALFYDRRQRGEDAADRARQLAQRVEAGPLLVKFKQNLGAWYVTESTKAQGAGSPTWQERIDDQYRMILYCINYVDHPSEIARLLDGMFYEDDTCWIWLSTVHKAKGLEADHVFLLRETFARYRKRRDRLGNLVHVPMSEIDPEELNVEYVAITRAKSALTWVYMEPEM